jgi:hypothetical protein
MRRAGASVVLFLELALVLLAAVSTAVGYEGALPVDDPSVEVADDVQSGSSDTAPGPPAIEVEPPDAPVQVDTGSEVVELEAPDEPDDPDPGSQPGLPQPAESESASIPTEGHEATVDLSVAVPPSASDDPTERPAEAAAVVRGLLRASAPRLEASVWLTSASAPRTDPVREFESLCGRQPRSEACKRFLAPHACTDDNPWNDFGPTFPASCEGILAANPCWGDDRDLRPDPEGCRLFLEQPCFTRPKGPACLFYLVQPPPGCVFDPPFRGDPFCRLWNAVLNDICETRPETCDTPFGGARETLSLEGAVDDGGRDPGEPDGEERVRDDGPETDRRTRHPRQLTEVDPGVLGSSEAGGSNTATQVDELSFTGLPLALLVAVGLGLTATGLTVRAGASASPGTGQTPSPRRPPLDQASEPPVPSPDADRPVAEPPAPGAMHRPRGARRIALVIGVATTAGLLATVRNARRGRGAR